MKRQETLHQPILHHVDIKTDFGEIVKTVQNPVVETLKFHFVKGGYDGYLEQLDTHGQILRQLYNVEILTDKNLQPLFKAMSESDIFQGHDAEELKENFFDAIASH